MTIGQLSRKTNVSAQTIRYYEREGLLPSPIRLGSGQYRDYDSRASQRLFFIRAAKNAGFTLRQIRELIDAQYREDACDRVRELVEARLVRLRETIAELTRFEHHLAGLSDACFSNQDNAHCPAIDSFDDPKLV